MPIGNEATMTKRHADVQSQWC